MIKEHTYKSYLSPTPLHRYFVAARYLNNEVMLRTGYKNNQAPCPAIVIKITRVPPLLLPQPTRY
jgi:hypothetical protein